MGQAVTIQDVAKLAGVSPATVSRVINGNGVVARHLADRVRAAVDTLDYRPNAVARSLRRKSAAVWQLIISDIENPFFTSMVRGVEDVAHAAGCSVVLCNADEDLGKERRYIEVALAERMSGVILSPASEEESEVEPLLRRGIPVVTVDRTLAERPATVHSVVTDNHRGAQLATAELLGAGYKSVACITGPLRVTTAQGRLAGYRSALASAGVRPRPELVRVADYKETGGRDAMLSLLELADPPEAVFVANNRMTIGALAAARQRSVSIPGDLGLVGFDDMTWSALTCCPLTTIAQPTYDVGASAARLLLEGPPGPSRPAKTVVLQPTLVVRGSSRR
ncbi:MAG: LacI family DNA-binding transcriptional regulator [Actinomycetota bacterium]|nr:LacI family DNA-binding transcriptional regulator [Actinomycetota bacterium]